MDLSKLAGEPWEVCGSSIPKVFEHCFLPLIYGPYMGGQLMVAKVGTNDVKRTPELAQKFLVDAEFIALARNAFGVMMRRGWWAVKVRSGGWIVADGHYGWVGTKVDDVLVEYSDPFTALVEAEKWYKEQVEGVKT